MQKVLIIGAGGIGSAIAKSIVASGGNVFIAGRSQGSLENQASELGCEFGLVEAADATSSPMNAETRLLLPSMV